MMQEFNLAQIILATADRYPDRIALRMSAGAVSYGRFRESVLDYASRMRGLGVKRNARVCIAIVNPASQIYVSLACALLGCSWVHGNEPAIGNDGIGITHVVHAGPQAPSLIGQAVRIDRGSLPQGPVDIGTFEGFESPDSIWFVAQSSGTTGTTKFMSVSASAQLRRLSQNPFDYLGDRLPVTCSRMHPLSVYGMEYVLEPLMMGGTVVLSDDWNFMCSAGVTTVIGSPAHYLGLNSQATTSQAKIQCAVIGGARCSEQLFDQLLERFEMVQHQFGCSELGRISFNRFGVDTQIRVSVGKPLPSAEVQIVDADNHPLPPMATGALRMRSDAPISGYIGEDHIELSHDGWFYSGDTGFLSEEGELTIVGRVNDVVNLGGIKLDANTLDDVITATEGVEEGACFAQSDFSPVDELAILIAPCDGEDAERIAERVHANLTARFGRNGAPRRIYVVKAIPKNENGKVARHLLTEHVANRVPFTIVQ